METALAAADDDRVLAGCTLPPKVAGVPRGAVLLSVPHVVPSMTADAAAERVRPRPDAVNGIPRLPRAPLVRVRWWGEDRPGSTLFRPTRLTNEPLDGRADGEEEDAEDDAEDDDRGDSSIRMRYPVCVPLEQLVDYLRDMKELVFDVVDRASRKKIGRSVLPFVLDRAVQAEDAVTQLRRSNALCEIHSTVDASVVLGYLTINFDVEWTAIAAVSTPLKWASSAAMAPAVSVNPKHTIGVVKQDNERVIQQRLSFSSVSSSSTASGYPRHIGWRRDAIVADPPPPEDRRLAVGSGSGRLENLLQKGRELEQSMSKAVADDVVAESSPDRVANGSGTVPSPTSMMLLMAPYEAMTEEVETSWERVLEDAEKIHTPAQRDHDIHAAVNTVRQDLDGVGVALGAHNALEISFESMELEQDMMDRLRQLREGSVSTRFSPIQLVVSHEHPKCLLRQSDSRESDHWIAAFAVNSSLRKRQWRTNYAHTLPLLAAGSSRQDSQAARLQVSQTGFKFRVRCKPQHASPTGRRKRDQTQSLDLTAEVNVKELFDHRDRPWVLSLPLRMDRVGGSKATKDRSTAKRRAPVGHITVKFRFCAMPVVAAEDSESTSDRAESSVWSRDERDHDSSQQHHGYNPVHEVRQFTAHHRLQTHSVERRDVGIPLFFGLLVGRALVRWPSAKATKQEQSAPKLSLRIDYGTPSFFGRSAKALRLKRSVKASLRVVENERLKANLSRMNAFPLDVSPDFVHRLERGLLILEAWVQEQSTTLTSYVTEKLIGVVKIPLHAFKSCTRDIDAIGRCLAHSTPFIGIDQDFPVVDPLDDEVNGQVHVQMAFGTAEQMFNLKSVLTAAVKVQSLTRGWLTRRALGYWKRFELTGMSDEHDEAQRINHHAPSTFEDDSSVPDRSPHSSDEQLVESECDSPADVVDPESNRLALRITRVDIRIELRGTYATSDEGNPVIGCEVYGHLRFHDDQDAPISPSASGPRFTLWWDANDARLNSHFVHSLQAASPMAGIQLEDVLLLLRVEPQPTAGAKQAQDTTSIDVKGVAGIDLASVVASEWSALEGSDLPTSNVRVTEDINLPIEWDLPVGERSRRGLAGYLPLRIGMTVVRGVAHDIGSGLSTASVAEDDRNQYNERLQEVTTGQTLSRTERLLPAALHLSLDIQRIADVRDMIQEHLAAAAPQSERGDAFEVLDAAMKRGSVILTVAMSLCLGVELHPEEDKHRHDGTVSQDDQGRWHKQFHFERIELDVVNGVQALPSITQGDVYVLVHAELVAFLQEGTLDIRLLVGEGQGGVPVGIVSVPLSAILFRPSGVQGSFPMRVDNVLAGRVGVHLSIEQDAEVLLSNNLANSQAIEERPTVDHQSLPPSPTSSVTIQEHSSQEYHEPTLEEAVASIHEAAQQIQHRLARFTARSNAPGFDEPDSARAAVDPSPSEYVDDTSEPSAPSLTLSPSDMSPRQTVYAEYAADVKEVGDDFGDTNVHVASPNEGSACDSELLSEASNEGDPFKPITLASLGIDELELSPISEANSPKFEDQDSCVQSADDSDADASLILQDQEELQSETDVKDAHERDHDDFSDDAESRCNSFSTNSDGGEAVDEEKRFENMTNGSGEQGRDDSANYAEEQRENSPVHPEASEASDNEENDFTMCAIDSLSRESADFNHRHAEDLRSATDDVTVSEHRDDSDIEADEVSIASPAWVDQSLIDHHELRSDGKEIDDDLASQSELKSNANTLDDCLSTTPAQQTLHDAIAVDHSDEQTGDDCDTRVFDLRKAAAVDGNKRMEGRQFDHHDIEGLPSGSENDQAALDDLNYSGDEAATTDHFGCGSEVGSNSLASIPNQDVNIKAGSPSLSESFTQTHDADLDDDRTEGSSHVRHTTEVVVSDKVLPLIDGFCQTSLDDVSDVDGHVAPDHSEDAGDVAIGTLTQEIRTHVSVVDSTPADPSNAARTTPSSGVNSALPVEKFNMAWQLLNEIRVLYVDANVEDQSISVTPAKKQPPSSALTAQDQLSNEKAISVTETSPLDIKEEVGHTLTKRDSPGSKPVGEADVAAFTPNDDFPEPWQWRGAAALKADVQERLESSKREYEETLALSQSMNSIHSWSSVSRFSTKPELATEWEEKAQELSASALAKRKSTARTHALFRVDTETERIARIMQGSLRYWLHNDDDEGDQDSDDESSEGDRALADNYF